MHADELLERAAERLLGDERLRGGLTDAGFGPLLDWALEELVRQGSALASVPEPEQAVDDLATALRAVVRDLVRAAESGDAAVAVEGLRQAEGAFGLMADRLADLRLGADPDENARRLMQALRD